MTRSLILIALSVMVSFAAQAQPLTDHVPEDAVVYVGWAGIDEQPSYEGSKFKAVLEATQLSQLFMRTLPDLMLNAAEGDAQAQETVALYRELAPAAWHRPWAFYFAGVDEHEGDEPSPRAGLVIRAGEYESVLAAQFERFAGMVNEEEPTFQARVEKRDDVLCLLIGSSSEGGGLAGGGTFEQSPASVEGEHALALYADVPKLLGVIDVMIRSESDEESVNRWHAVCDALGLDGARQLIYAGGFEGESWQWRMHLGAPAPRRGLLAAMEGAPIDDAAMKLLPAGTTWMQVSHLDLGKVFDSVRDAIHAAGDGEDFNEAMAQAHEETGIDIAAALRRFGPRWILYSEPGVAVNLFGTGIGLCLINHPRDPAGLVADLNAIEAYVNENLLAESEMTFRITQIQQGDLTIHTLGTPFVSPSWAVRDERMYLSLIPQGVMMADIYARQDKSILDNDRFTKLRDQLGEQAGATGLTFVDLPQTAPGTYSSYLMLTQMMMSLLPPEVAPNGPGMLLPPLGLILPHLEPAGAVAWQNDEGFAIRACTPFPGASLLSHNSTTFGGGGVAVSAVGVGIMLPALGAARDAAGQIQSNTQARGLHQAAVMYAQSNNSRFPDELYPMYENNYFTIETLIAPRSEIEEPADFDEWPRNEQRNWVRAHASYVLLPGKSETLDPEEIQLFGKPSHHDDNGIPVTWGDNHVTFETDLESIDRALVEQTGKSLQQHIVESEQPIGDDPAAP